MMKYPNTQMKAVTSYITTTNCADVFAVTQTNLVGSFCDCGAWYCGDG